MSQAPMPGSPTTASPAIASLCSGPGSAPAGLWGGVCSGISQTRSSPSSSRAWRASATWPAWGGLKVPPRMPIAGTQLSRSDVPVALDEVLERAQLAQPDRPARVKLLCRVADLGSHPELAAVGEAGGGVDVHAGGVDAELER